uniref:sperm-associated antigen 16 protein-like n=1 Tax=Doryrhamphus excisus TaxID=161450 RepID=UPI0025AE355E|nr:sperm-associated antigen 16 protein-like [Doryrhamphus excisus]
MEQENVVDHEEDEDEYDDEDSLSEEDLEATVQTINEREKRAQTLSSGFELPVTVDDFLRSFLSEMGMTATLDCFQAEWTEAVHRRLVDPKQVDVIPDIYPHIQRLHNELKHALREREEYRGSASASAETLARAQKALGDQRMKLKRAEQEKSRLVEETKRLMAQCSACEPEVRKMDGKYQALVQQTVKVALERNKVLMQAKPAQSQSSSPIRCRTCREMRRGNPNGP